MPDRGYTFDEKSAKAIEKVVLHVLASQQPRRQPPYKRRPSGGGTTVGGGTALFILGAGKTIPGRDGSTAGSADLIRATIDAEGALSSTEEQFTVWNTSTIPIHAETDVYLKAIDVDGQWVAISHELELVDKYDHAADQVLAHCPDSDPTWHDGSPLVDLAVNTDASCQWTVTATDSCGEVTEATFGLTGIDIVTRVYCENGQIKYDVAQCAPETAPLSASARPSFLPPVRPAF